jgi:deoxyribonuclease IV
MFKIGLKLWSTNEQYVHEAIRLYEHGFCDYIELFAVPKSFEHYVGLWAAVKKKTNIMMIIHAAHLREGVNLAQSPCFENNMVLAREALAFADELGALSVIFHPGTNGQWQETCRQISHIHDARIAIENKPYFVSPELICNGATYEEVKSIIDATRASFCCDIGHAVCAANALHQDPREYVKRFLSLQPRMFHLADGDWCGVYDQHDHLGHGSFKLNELLRLLPENSMITLEPAHDSDHSLVDFESDAAYVRMLEKQWHRELMNTDITLNPATLDDLHDIFNLSNDDEVRRNSINIQKITWDDHVAWFNEQIRSKEDYFFVARNKNNDFVGQVRFDKVRTENCLRISVSLCKEFRNKGFGAHLIALSSQRVLNNTQATKICAYIKPENGASLKAFSKAGYVAAGSVKVDGVELSVFECTSR